MAVFVFSTTSTGASLDFHDGSHRQQHGGTSVLTRQLCKSGEPCLWASNPRLTYHAFGFDVTGGFV